jgi:methyl-accepting chemotaxis protein
MKRIHIGLRIKLILAFLLIAIIPLLIVAYFFSQHGFHLRKNTADLQALNEKVLMSLSSHSKYHDFMEEELLAWVKEKLTPDNQAMMSEFHQHLDNISAEEDVHFRETILEFQNTNQDIVKVFGGLASERYEFFAWLLAVVVAVASVFAFILGKVLANPITQLTESAWKISQGEIEQHVQIRAKDEIGQLHNAFNAMTQYMKEMAHVANNIAKGNIKKTLPPKGSKDMLGTAFHTMGQYLGDIAAIAHKISDGNLVDTIPVKSPDDALGAAFRKMTTNLVETIRQIKEEVQTIEQASDTAAKRSERDLKMVEDVLSSAEETSSSMMQMQASVEEVSENMNVLSISIEETVTSIEQMNMAIKHIAANSTGLSDSAKETFGVVQEITESIKHLVATAQQAEGSSKEASESANAGQTSVRAIIEGMETIHNVVSTSAEMIKALGSRSEEIGSITNVITEIADQTSLLALNASIIAAQAGEHGRGFAVVADEVKELAHRSSVAAKEIEELIKGVQAESQKAIQSMVEGRQAVENGVVLANRGGEALEKILKSVEKALESIADNTRIAHEQEALSERVREYMENVVTMVNEIVRATGEQQQGSMQIAEAVGKMRNLSEQVKRATTEQKRGTYHVLEAMDSVTMRVQESSNRAQEVAKFSINLAKQTHTLMNLLDRFNIGHQEHSLVPNSPQEIVESETISSEIVP